MIKTKENLKIIPLGGLGEVGKNMLLIEYQNKILIVDMGLRFPEEDMPGIDYLLPNIKYLEKKQRNVLGVLMTHGHYDHIGAVPYLIERLDYPTIFASELTRAIILRRQEEFPGQKELRIKEVKNGDKITLSPFRIEFFRQNHNIPQNLGLFIETPVGNIVITSDFKFDQTPVNDPPTDFGKLRELAKRRVLLLVSDSTNAEEKGHSLSEKQIFENLGKLFPEIKGRIIVATFSSLINRLQQLITLSEKYGRKVVVEGHSMKIGIEIAKHLNYIKAKSHTFIPAKRANDYPDSKITILCTGAQGEEEAVLMRIANREHKFIHLKKGDTIIFSSSVVPGNERAVQILKDEFYRQGANVFHYKMMDIHAGGHAHQDELKEMINIMRPKFFLPAYGQFSMLVNHAKLAEEMGVPQRNIILAENGKIINLSESRFFFDKKQAPANNIMVDGLGIGDVGEIVLRDRQNLARDGMFVIIAVVDRQTGKVRGSPDIISRGFVYLRESKDLLSQTRRRVVGIVDRTVKTGGPVNWTYIKDEIRNKVGQFLFSKTQRRPMILPVVIEV